MIPSGIEPATFRLVVLCLNQFLHRVPQLVLSVIIIFLNKAYSRLTIRIRIRMESPDPARKLYDIHHCCVYSEKLLMMDRGIVRNM